jgi:DNA-binding cell septation regulator SpoVG
MKEITWNTKMVEVVKIKPTPDNYKLKTEIGLKRLQTSLKKFGLAGTAVCNLDLTLIDGNSRVEEAKKNGRKKMWVSLPSRKLTAAEFKDMSQLFDYAVAGAVDIDRIHQDHGTSKRFFKEWDMEVPLHLLDKIGKKGDHEVALSKLGYPEEAKNAVESGENIVMVNLFFNAKQEAEFRKHEERLAKKYKTASTTDTVLKVFKLMK